MSMWGSKDVNRNADDLGYCVVERQTKAFFFPFQGHNMATSTTALLLSLSSQNDRADMTLHVAKSCLLPPLCEAMEDKRYSDYQALDNDNTIRLTDSLIDKGNNNLCWILCIFIYRKDKLSILLLFFFENFSTVLLFWLLKKAFPIFQ